jgi:hypothetical protein
MSCDLVTSRFAPRFIATPLRPVTFHDFTLSMRPSRCTIRTISPHDFPLTLPVAVRTLRPTTQLQGQRWHATAPSSSSPSPRWRRRLLRTRTGESRSWHVWWWGRAISTRVQSSATAVPATGVSTTRIPTAGVSATGLPAAAGWLLPSSTGRLSAAGRHDVSAAAADAAEEWLEWSWDMWWCKLRL